MNDERDATRLEQAAYVIASRAGRKRRDRYAYACLVPWSELDELADALREEGWLVGGPSLGRGRKGAS